MKRKSLKKNPSQEPELVEEEDLKGFILRNLSRGLSTGERMAE
jgi:hypothetical protein